MFFVFPRSTGEGGSEQQRGRKEKVTKRTRRQNKAGFEDSELEGEGGMHRGYTLPVKSFRTPQFLGFIEIYLV